MNELNFGFQHNKKIAVILNEFGEGVVDEKSLSVGNQVPEILCLSSVEVLISLIRLL